MKKLVLLLLGGAAVYWFYKNKTNALSKLTVGLSKLKFLGITGTGIDLKVDAVVNNPTDENLFIPQAQGSVKIGSKKITDFISTIGIEAKKKSKTVVPLIINLKLADLLSAGIDFAKNGLKEKVLIDTILKLGDISIPVRNEFDFSFSNDPKETTDVITGITELQTETVIDPLVLNNPSKVQAVNFNGEIAENQGAIISITSDQVQEFRPGTPVVSTSSQEVVEVDLNNGNTVILLPGDISTQENLISNDNPL